MTKPALTIRRLRARAVRLPMRRPLRVSSGLIATACFVLLDLETEEGITGRAYLYSFFERHLPLLHAAVAELGTHVAGRKVEPTLLFAEAMKRYRLLDPKSMVGIAVSGLDIACWDALAKAADLPLARYLGGALTPVATYNSNGLGIVPAAEAADEAKALLAEGFHAIKVRLGRPSRADDLAVVRAVKKAIPADAILMADYNQALSVTEAVVRGHALDGEGLDWIEEPVRHDDYAGNARVAAALATPIQIGENFVFPQAMAAALAANACDYVMPDVQRIGGVSGWLRAAALADAAGIEMSSHLFPEVSAHLLAVTPTAHWLEYMDWANPILAEPLAIADGKATPPDRAGHGMAWDEAAVKRFEVA
jgi:mandelate racemase